MSTSEQMQEMFFDRYRIKIDKNDELIMTYYINFIIRITSMGFDEWIKEANKLRRLSPKKYPELNNHEKDLLQLYDMNTELKKSDTVENIVLMVDEDVDLLVKIVIERMEKAREFYIKIAPILLENANNKGNVLKYTHDMMEILRVLQQEVNAFVTKFIVNDKEGQGT